MTASAETRRDAMVARQIAARGIRDARLLAAMRTVPRELFVPADLAEFAYSDTPLPIAALLWTWVYNADYGLANYYLQAIGVIDHPVFWLANRDTAMPAVIAMHIWAGAGFNMLVYLAGLQAVPNELYEAAEVDGAGGWTKFRRITLPLIAPTTFFLLIINLVGAK